MRNAMVACSMALMTMACNTGATIEDAAEVELDPRQGERVYQICTNRTVLSNTTMLRGRAVDRRSVVLEIGREAYKFDLLGSCDPTKGLTSFASGGGTDRIFCLYPGDTAIMTGSGSCSIHRMFKWNEAAAAPETTESEAAEIEAIER